MGYKLERAKITPKAIKLSEIKEEPSVFMLQDEAGLTRPGLFVKTYLNGFMPLPPNIAEKVPVIGLEFPCYPEVFMMNPDTKVIVVATSLTVTVG